MSLSRSVSTGVELWTLIIFDKLKKPHRGAQHVIAYHEDRCDLLTHCGDCSCEPVIKNLGTRLNDKWLKS